jgi:hypothetical protein
MANRILRANGDNTPVGKGWISGFKRRNPRVKTVIGRRIEAPRAEAASPELIRAFLELFEATRVRLGIRTDDMYNMDETGTALGICTNTQVLADAQKKKAYIKSPENREWVSTIELISADGRKLRCATIFKGQALQTTWFLSELIPNWLYTTSENGWTSNDIGVKWLEAIFIPDTQPDTDRYRLLILDGHGSHISIDFLWLCKQHKIHLLFLPPHSSHILQPLDLAPFSVLKSRYRSYIAELATLNNAALVKKERYTSCYYMAREEGLTDRVIRAGWKAAGLCPFNINQVLQSSQIIGRRSTPPSQNRPTTSIQLIDPIYQTPQGHRDIYRTRLALERSEKLSQNTRVALYKAGKAISLANTQVATLQAAN